MQVARVSDENPEILQYLSKLGVALGTELAVTDMMNFDGSLRVKVGDREQFISSKLAQNIFVTTLEKAGTSQ